MDKNEFAAKLEEMAAAAAHALQVEGMKLFDKLTENERKTLGDEASGITPNYRLAKILLLVANTDGKVIESQIGCEAIKPNVKRARRILNNRVC